MATFRKYGGINRSSILNYVKHDILSSNSSSFITSGLSNSKETFLSDIDMSGNSIINVNKIIFKDGFIIDGSLTLNPTLAQVLSNGNSAGSYNIDMNGNIITNIGYLNQTVADNINLFNSKCQYSNNSIVFNNLQDIPNKQYVDNIASGISPTYLCDCATTEDISLNLPGPILSTIDGASLTDGMRVLVKCQDSSNNVSSANINNGIYIYSTTGYTRASDCSGQDVTNQLTFISNGTINGMKAFVQYLSGAIAGINNLQYVPFYSINYNLGQGLEIVGGSTLQVDSCLNFLNYINITSNTNTNDSLCRIQKNSKYFDFYSDLSSNAYSKLIKNGDNAIICGTSNSFVISSWNDGYNGVRIDVSSVEINSSSITSTVKYILTIDNSLDNIGHNFYGNIFLDSNIVFPNLRTNAPINNSLGYVNIINTTPVICNSLSSWIMIGNSIINLKANKTYLLVGGWVITTSNGSGYTLNGAFCMCNGDPSTNPLKILDGKYSFASQFVNPTFPYTRNFNYIVTPTIDISYAHYVLIPSTVSDLSANCLSFKYTELY